MIHKYLSFCIASLLFMVSATFTSPLPGQALWDKENSAEREAVHKYLFDNYVKDKKCLSLSQGQLLSEVVVFQTPQEFNNSTTIDLPQGTRSIAPLFGQLSIRGVGIAESKVAFIDQNGLRQPLEKISGSLITGHLFRFPNLSTRKIGQRRLQLQITGSGQGKMIVAVSLKCPSGEFIKRDFTAHQNDRQKSPHDLSGRHEKFLLSTVSRNFDELARSLGESSDSYDRIVGSAQMGPALQDFAIRGALADRRVAKLYEGLSRMNPEEAEKVALDMFDESFDAYKARWDFAGASLPSCKMYAPKAHLFLCSEFCDQEQVLAKMDEWNEWQANSPSLATNNLAGLDAFLAINLLINMARKKNAWTTEETNNFLALKLGTALRSRGSYPPRVQMTAFPASDWTPSQGELIGFIPVFTEYASIVNPAIQELAVKVLKNELRTNEPE